MMKLLSLGVLVLFVQCYVSTATSNILLSNENANSFLQTKSRNKRGIHEGLREECCYENCDFEERAEFSETYGWTAVGDALCEVSNVEKRSCTCKARAGYNYECGGYSCRDKPCKCEGKKDPKDWEVLGVSYDVARGSLSEHPIAASSKTVDNLNGEVQVEPSFSVSKTVTEEESFSHTVGSSLSVGASFSVGVPVVAEAEITTTLTLSYEHTFGKTKSKSETRTATLPCPAPAHRYVICHGMIKAVKMSVPYTMTIKHKHYGCTCESKGVYENVHHTNIYLKPVTYTSKPSGDEVEDAKLVEDQSQLIADEDQFVEDKSKLTTN